MNQLSGGGMTLELPSSQGQFAQHKSRKSISELGEGRVAFNGRYLRTAVEWAGAVASRSESNELYIRVGRQELRVDRPMIELDETAGGDAAQLLAPMPGRIIAVGVASGDSVQQGALLVTLEAMKMEHSLIAKADNVIDSVPVSVGDQVDQGAVLVRFSADQA